MRLEPLSQSALFLRRLALRSRFSALASSSVDRRDWRRSSSLRLLVWVSSLQASDSACSGARSSDESTGWAGWSIEARREAGSEDGVGCAAELNE
jgi:hypothetical protein